MQGVSIELILLTHVLRVVLCATVCAQENINISYTDECDRLHFTHEICPYCEMCRADLHRSPVYSLSKERQRKNEIVKTSHRIVLMAYNCVAIANYLVGDQFE